MHRAVNRVIGQRGQSIATGATRRSRKSNCCQRSGFPQPFSARGMRLRSGSTSNLSRLKALPGATEADSETAPLADSPGRKKKMEQGRGFKDASTSGVTQRSAHRKTVTVMGLPLSPELVAISLGANLRPCASPRPRGRASAPGHQDLRS